MLQPLIQRLVPNNTITKDYSVSVCRWYRPMIVTAGPGCWTKAVTLAMYCLERGTIGKIN